MMNLLKHQLILPSYKLLLTIFFGLAAISVSYFWIADFESYSDPNRAMTFVGGLCVALTIATLQLLITILEQKEIWHYRKIGIRDVLERRDDKVTYQKHICAAHSKIFIMGSTCSRLLEDFGRGEYSGSRSLVDALERNVNVRLLVANIDSLEKPDRDRIINTTIPLAKYLSEKHPNHFHLRFLAGPAIHNLSVFDETCILGPIFPGTPSKDTPAIITELWSPPANSYINYFENQWQAGTAIE